EPVPVRHQPVGDHHRVVLLVEEAPGLLAALRRVHLVAEVAEGRAEGASEVGIVLDEQDAHGAGLLWDRRVPGLLPGLGARGMPRPGRLSRRREGTPRAREEYRARNTARPWVGRLHRNRSRRWDLPLPGSTRSPTARTGGTRPPWSGSSAPFPTGPCRTWPVNSGSPRPPSCSPRETAGGSGGSLPPSRSGCAGTPPWRAPGS